MRAGAWQPAKGGFESCLRSLPDRSVQSVMLTQSPDQPFWIQSRMAVSPSAHLLDLASQAALFCERTQNLFEFNPTAAEIWAKLADGWSCRAIAEHFEQGGLPASDARSFVNGMANAWMAAGYLAPADIVSVTEGRPDDERRLRVGPVTVSLRFFGSADLDAFDKVFGHLRTSDPSEHLSVDIVEKDQRYFLIRDKRPLGAARTNTVIPAVKALLTADCCEAIRTGFLAHGALVSKNGKRIFVTGPPGAGKTTLTMGLLASGFSFCGDDIVHVDPDGLATGLPFAAAVKSGAWTLLASRYPDLSKTPAYERADGQVVRYVVPPNRDPNDARPIDVVILLSRDASSPAAAERLQPLQGLCDILASGYSRNKRMDAETMRAFAANLGRASHYRLVYSDLAGAVAAISALT